MRNGLPDQTVRAISETPDGYLWIGTSDGLARFDGSRFKSYSHENVPAFRDDVITRLLTAQDGGLWISTEGGGLVHYASGKFHGYESANIPGGNFIRDLCESSNHAIWAATDVGMFRVRDDRLERADEELGTPAINMGAVIEDHLGRMWVGGGELFVSDHGKAREYILQKGDSRSRVKSLFETRDGSIWAGTVEGLYRLSPGSPKFARVPGVGGTIRSMHEDSNGDLWIGSIAEGVYIIHNGKVSRLAAQRNPIDSAVFSIFGDSEQDVWLGTRNGITRFSRSSVQIVDFPGNLDSDFGTISKDVNGSLWAASSQLVHIQGDKSIPWHFAGLEGISIRNILRARDQSLWIGTIGYGLYHLTSSKLDHFVADRGLVDNYVRSLTESRDGSLWIGTDNGVSHLDAHGFHNLTDKKGLSYNSIRTIVEDKSGDIWIGTDHGLDHLRAGLFLQDAATRALSNQMVWAVLQDSDGGLWFGTRGAGLFSYRDAKVSRYDTTRGLVSDNIYCILEDTHKRLWLSGPNAVMSVDLSELTRKANNPAQTLSMRIYSANRGTVTTQLFGGTQPSGAIARNGNLYFPASHGFWIVHPDLENEPHLVHVNIDSIAIDGRVSPPASSLDISAASNRIEIAYALVALNLQDTWRTKYKLNGFDKDWIVAAPNQRVAAYTNIPPGRYTFQIESSESDRPEYKATAWLNIVKHQFFYQTLWFQSVCFLAIVALLFLAYYIRLKQLKGKFDAIIAERTRIAREMHDTLLQGCASVSALLRVAVNDDVQDADSRLHLVQYASTQIEATMDEAREAVAGLRTAKQTSGGLVDSVRRMTEKSSREHGVESNLVVIGEPFAMNPHTSHSLTMVVREAVFNAILHANPQTISIKLSFSADALRIEVADDGQGFVVAASRPEEHYGIQGMIERIAAFGGTMNIESSTQEGTSVVIHLPRDGALTASRPAGARSLPVFRS